MNQMKRVISVVLLCAVGYLIIDNYPTKEGPNYTKEKALTSTNKIIEDQQEVTQSLSQQAVTKQSVEPEQSDLLVNDANDSTMIEQNDGFEVEPEKETRVTVNEFAKIADHQQWLAALIEGADESSYQRSSAISSFIYDHELLSTTHSQVECGKVLCGLLFTDLTSDIEAQAIINTFQQADIKGRFLHYNTVEQETGVYTARLMLGNQKDMSTDEFITIMAGTGVTVSKN